MRILLGLDTASEAATFALARAAGDNVTVIAQKTLGARNTAAELVPALRAMLTEAELEWSSVSAVAVTAGPGSFTGVRVGLATAKGLVESSGIPLLAVSSLRVLAAQLPGDAPRYALLDAGRGEFYGGRSPGGDEALLRLEEVSAFTADHQVVVCQPAVAERVSSAGIAARMVLVPDASALLRFASPLLARGERSGPVTLDANYLRRSDAENKALAGAL